MAKETKTICDVCGNVRSNEVKHGPDGWEGDENETCKEAANLVYLNFIVNDLCYGCVRAIKDSVKETLDRREKICGQNPG